ncbi:MAG: hypothetical protein AB1918_13585 [Pseudomonadota bacterium]
MSFLRSGPAPPLREAPLLILDEPGEGLAPRTGLDLMDAVVHLDP